MLELTTPPDTSGQLFEYVPDVLGNRALKEPFVVVLKTLSAKEMKNVKAVLGTGKAGRGEIDFDDRAWKLAQRLFENYVVEVRNFRTVNESGETVLPCNGKELWFALERASDLHRQAISDDITDALRDFSKLEEGAIKNSKSRPAST